MTFIPTHVGWTHEQELDLIELGEKPAKCLKGENHAPDRARLVAGRAYRAQKLSERMRRLSRRPWWADARAERLEQQLRHRDRREKVLRTKIAALEHHRERIADRLDEVRREIRP